MFESSRKWNINRHIKAVHRGNAIAFNLRSGKLSKSSAPSFKRVKDGLVPFTHDTGISKNELEFAKIESDLNLSSNKETKAMMSIYEELSERISKLELFSPNEISQFQISIYLMYSLLTENPIHTLDEIIQLIRFKHAKQKINSHVSKFFDGDPIVTDAILSILIKDTQCYMSKSNFQSI